MKKEIIMTAKTVEEAVKMACQKLDIDRDDASVEVLELPKKGFLKLGQVDAKVKVSYLKNDISKLDIAKNYLNEVLLKMGIENFDIETEEINSKKVIFTLKGENLGIAIGKRGDTLNALQHICSIVANMSGGSYYSVTLNVGNYREKRETTLKDLAKKIASSVKHTGRSITLEPMNAYERKVIHEEIQGIEGIKSESIGKEPYRHVVISSLYGRNDKVLDKNEI